MLYTDANLEKFYQIQNQRNQFLDKDKAPAKNSSIVVSPIDVVLGTLQIIFKKDHYSSYVNIDSKIQKFLMCSLLWGFFFTRF